MTEQEWLTGESPQKMRGRLEESGGTSERKLRLFAAACCRRVGRWLLDPCQHAAVGVLERYADGLATASELYAAVPAAGEIDEGHPLLSEGHTAADRWREAEASSGKNHPPLATPGGSRHAGGDLGPRGDACSYVVCRCRPNSSP
jgi:hypothetical protein